MCDIDGCNKRGFAESLTTGVIICEKHIEIRPEYKVLTDKISLKKFRKYMQRKGYPSPIRPRKANNNRCDCVSYSYLSDQEIKSLLRKGK